MLPSFVHKLETKNDMLYDFSKRAKIFKKLNLHKNIKKKFI